LGSRLRRSLLASTVIAGASTLGAVVPGSASAATLPADLQPFADCPVQVSGVVDCLNSQITGGSITIGAETINITSPITLTVGLEATSTGFVAVLPTDGTPALSGAPLPVPIFSLPPLPGILSVTATTNVVSPPTLSLGNLLAASGTGISLPIDVPIHNTLIGKGCQIGTSRSPITLNLTTGTTSPPSPNTPITGATGTLSVGADSVITLSGMTLVDNSFSAPGASGCGLFGILDPALDLIAGLPAGAGHNSATLNATSELVASSVVSAALNG